MGVAWAPESSSDRFIMASFTNYQSALRTESEIYESRIAELIREAAPYSARSSPKLPIRVHIENSSCAAVARVLLDLDLELRRASTFLSSGNTRPAVESRAVQVATIARSSAIDVTLEASREIYLALTSRPIALLQVLDWFWLHRQTRTRVRPPYEVIDPVFAWTEMLRTA
jgi:hypothetical protein